MARPAAHPRLCALRELRGVQNAALRHQICDRLHACTPPVRTPGPALSRAEPALLLQALWPVPFTSSLAEQASSTHVYSGFICTFRNFTTPDPYCRATGPLACFESCTSAVFCPLSTTSRWGPCAVIS